MTGFARFAELTRVQLSERTGGLVVIPLAATEQHGDHLPTQTDSAIVTALAERTCAIVGEAIHVTLAPTVVVGVSGHHLPFGGTLSVTSDTFIRSLIDMVTALRSQGFTRTFFINGHGGNDASMRVAIERLALTAEERQSAAGLSYWNAAERALQPKPEFPVPGHAGAFETSIMLALHPALVHLDRAPAEQGPFPLVTNEVPGVSDSRFADWRLSDGRTDGPAAATKEFGETALDALSREIAELIASHVRLLDERSATTTQRNPA
ncbi:MAG: creatininase family protein [Salinibacterium sp.]|nr:creatininase family protein [Salinibacterium sp.]